MSAKILTNLYRLSSANQLTRRKRLLTILNEIGSHYFIQREKFNDRWIENIIIPFGHGKKNVVVGAHYDSVKGSTGANDNMSGVCVLLELVEHFLKSPPQNSLHIVFFDLEEGYCAGSQMYVKRFGKKSTLAMLNFDICGHGDSLLVSPKKNVEKSFFSKYISLNSRKYRVVENLPGGDEAAFEIKNIPNVSICIVPKEDVKALVHMSNALKNNVKPTKIPRIVETMHNGKRDTVKVVSPKAILTVAKWAQKTLVSLLE